MQKVNESFIVKFFKLESAGGIVLMAMAALAILVANSPLREAYDAFLNTPVAVQVGDFKIAKPLLLWINDGLMAIFFFLIGLELKRELTEGELSDKRNIILPGVGAIGGMAGPALIYVYLNWGDPIAMKGWAIPAATDIAFALGVLSLLGSRVPTSIKVLLTSLAIFDDIGAILVIAFFYTEKISMVALIVVFCCLPLLYVLNRRGIESRSVYIMVGAVMWVAMLKSGIHATLAGVILAMFIPMKSRVNADFSPLKSLEHDLHTLVAFFVLPVFAFANAGLNLSGVGLDQLLHPVPLGIGLGLVVGKQIGIFGCFWLALKLKWASMPKAMSYRSLYALAALCGIGFTMSLFIGSLAFDESGGAMVFDERLGIVLGSLISGILGFFLLKTALPNHPKAQNEA